MIILSLSILLYTVILVYIFGRDKLLTWTKGLVIFVTVFLGCFVYNTVDKLVGYPTTHVMGETVIQQIILTKKHIYVWASPKVELSTFESKVLALNTETPRAYEIPNTPENRKKWSEAKARMQAGYLVINRKSVIPEDTTKVHNEQLSEYELFSIHPSEYMRKE